MHFCCRGGFRFPLVSFLQINVVRLVHSDLPSLSSITAQCRICWSVFTFRLLALWNPKAQPSFCSFLFALRVFLENYIFFQTLSFFFFLLLLLRLFFFHVPLHPLLFLHPLNSTHHSFRSSFALPPSPSQSTSVHYPSSSSAFFSLSLFPLILFVFSHLLLLVYLPSLLLSFFSSFCHISFCFPSFLHIYILLFYFTYFCSVSSDYSYLFTCR